MSYDVIYCLVCSLVLVLLMGYKGIGFLASFHAQQSIREEGPKNHQVKAGTPTMGGIFILISIVVTSLFFIGSEGPLWLLLLLTVGHGALGFSDDFIKAIKKRNLGLTAKQKLVGQIILAAVFSILLVHLGYGNTFLWIPLWNHSIDLGWFYYPFVFVVIVGATNAVNLTDGLDGLAAGTSAVAAITYSLIALMVGQSSLSIFGAALCGACLGFLFYNSHPAKVFMGDTGSLAIGGALAGLAILTKTEILLVLIGGVFVMEALSVILQVLSFKTRGVRIFKMSPIHHHFELSGWKETKVVTYFWIASIICSILGILIMWFTIHY